MAIFIKLSDEESKKLGPLINFIRIDPEITFKDAFKEGVFSICEKKTDDNKILELLKEEK